MRDKAVGGARFAARTAGFREMLLLSSGAQVCARWHEVGSNGSFFCVYFFLQGSKWVHISVVPCLSCPALSGLHVRVGASFLVLDLFFLSFRTLKRPLRHMTPRRANVGSHRLACTSGTVRATVGGGRVPNTMLTIMHRNGLTCLGTCKGGRLLPGARRVSIGAMFSVTSIDGTVSATVDTVVLVRHNRLQLASHIDLCVPKFSRSVHVASLVARASKLPPCTPIGRLATGCNTPGPGKLVRCVSNYGAGFGPKASFRCDYLGCVTLRRIVRAIDKRDLHSFTGARVFSPLNVRRASCYPAKRALRQYTPARGRGSNDVLGKVIRSPLTHVVGTNISNGTNIFSSTGSLTVLTTVLLGGKRCGKRHVLDPLKMGAVEDVPQRVPNLKHTLK